MNTKLREQGPGTSDQTMEKCVRELLVPGPRSPVP